VPGWLAFVVLIVGAVAWLVCRARRSPRPRCGDRDWLPAELRDAQLVWSEKAFRSQAPVPIAVRIDRAYRLPDGVLVLIEFKRRTRRRMHLSDVVELSVQRYVLQHAGHVVSRRAYVVVILPDGTRSRAVPVELESAKEVEHRAARLVDLRARRASPNGPTRSTVCASCGHRAVCPRTAQ
jgi:CRISPR-associated exonuclease Cas4